MTKTKSHFADKINTDTYIALEDVDNSRIRTEKLSLTACEKLDIRDRDVSSQRPNPNSNVNPSRQIAEGQE